MSTALSTANGKASTALVELSAQESNALKTSEAAIQRGLSTFVEVGRALTAIRDGTLYRQTHRTFAMYCNERWEFKKRRAYQLIDASAAAENVQHAAQIPNARQAEELAQAPVEMQAEIWDTVVEEHGENLTAATVREEVERRGFGSPKVDNGCRLIDKPGSVAALILQLDDDLRKLFEKWPNQHRVVFADKLSAFLDEIKATLEM